MKWAISLNGHVFELDPADLPAAEQVEPGVYSVLHHGRSLEIRIIRAPDGWNLQAGGMRFTAEVRDPRDAGRRSNAALGSGRQNILAPMPGKVIRVLVGERDQVEPGQGLIVVEAMKMQNEMKATRSGKIVQVRVRDGDTVTAGDVLLTLE